MLLFYKNEITFDSLAVEYAVDAGEKLGDWKKKLDDFWRQGSWCLKMARYVLALLAQPGNGEGADDDDDDDDVLFQF